MFTNNCYANVIIQLFARIDALYTIIKNISECSEAKDDCIIQNLMQITSDLRENKNQNAIDICNALGFVPMAYYEPDEFFDALIHHLCNTYPERFLQDLKISARQYNIVLTMKKDIERQIIDILSEKDTYSPKILIISCGRRDARDKAQFKYPLSFSMSPGIQYELVAVIFHAPKHFNIAIKYNQQFTLFDDARCPKTINDICAAEYLKNCGSVIYEKNVDRTINQYIYK